MSTTPRKLVQQLYAASNWVEELAIRALIQGTRHANLVDDSLPGQAMPTAIRIEDIPDLKREPVGRRPLSEVVDLLNEGRTLSLEVGSEEYCIEVTQGQILFTIYDLCETGEAIYSQSYDSLDILIQEEGSRSSFELDVFMAIG